MCHQPCTPVDGRPPLVVDRMIASPTVERKRAWHAAQSVESGPFQRDEVDGRSCPSPFFRSSQAVKEGLTMKNRNLAVWMVVVTVVALVLASLNITSQGPLPYVHEYQGHTAPAWA
jgi:hypothetical protein